MSEAIADKEGSAKVATHVSNTLIGRFASGSLCSCALANAAEHATPQQFDMVGVVLLLLLPIDEMPEVEVEVEEVKIEMEETSEGK